MDNSESRRSKRKLLVNPGDFEHVYLLCYAELGDFYKIGRSADIIERFTYFQNCLILATNICNNSISLEKKLLKSFGNKFRNVKIGEYPEINNTETFSGTFDEVVREYNRIVLNEPLIQPANMEKYIKYKMNIEEELQILDENQILVESMIKQEFPLYKRDVSFNGSLKFIKVSKDSYDTLTIRYINENILRMLPDAFTYEDQYGPIIKKALIKSIPPDIKFEEPININTITFSNNIKKTKKNIEIKLFNSPFEDINDNVNQKIMNFFMCDILINNKIYADSVIETSTGFYKTVNIEIPRYENIHDSPYIFANFNRYPMTLFNYGTKYYIKEQFIHNIPSKLIVYHDTTYELFNKHNIIIHTNIIEKLSDILLEIDLQDEDIFDSIENYNSYIKNLRCILKKTNIILNDIHDPMFKEILYLLR